MSANARQTQGSPGGWTEDAAAPAPTVADDAPRPGFGNAELGALAHLYRGEVYRCTVWRTRLDTTTNWAVVTLGVALSISYASPFASPLPLVLVGVSNLFFLTLEARRYRYCDLWRSRFRSFENNMYAPILTRGEAEQRDGWQDSMAESYLRPEFQISYLHAMGRRVVRSYLWIMLIQIAAFLGKLVVHPTPVASWAEFGDRAAVGSIPGWVILASGLNYAMVFIALAIWCAMKDRHARLQYRVPLPDAIY